LSLLVIREGADIRTQPWLTKAGGLPILSSALIFGLIVYLGDDLRSGFKSLSLKLAGVADLQADFSTAKQEAVHVLTRTEHDAYHRTDVVLARAPLLQAVLESKLRSANTIIATRAGSDQLATARKWERIEHFHKVFSKPLACLMACYIENFPQHD